MILHSLRGRNAAGRTEEGESPTGSRLHGSYPKGVVFEEDGGRIAVELVGGDDAVAELAVEGDDADHRVLARSSKVRKKGRLEDLIW
jgi:hypothetical protein